MATKEFCEAHRKPLAPRGMAWLIDQCRENVEMKNANRSPLIDYEIKRMRFGVMASRHFERETYCEDIWISYKS